MPQRPMQTHTQRQAWGGHSAIAHPPAPLPARPAVSRWPDLCPHSQAQGNSWVGE